MLGTGGKATSGLPKMHIFTVALRNCKESPVKCYIPKPIYPNLVGLSTIFFPRLSEEIFFHFFFDPDPMELTFLIYFSFTKDSVSLQNSYLRPMSCQKDLNLIHFKKRYFPL